MATDLNLSGRVATILHAAETYAVEMKHRQVLPSHVFVAFMSDKAGVGPAVVRKLGGDPAALLQRVHGELARLPRTENAVITRSSELDDIIGDARARASAAADELTRSSHLMRSMVELAGGPVKRALQDAGITPTSVDYGLRHVKHLYETETAQGGPTARSTPSAPGAATPPAGARPMSSERPAPNGRDAAADGMMLERYGRNLTRLAREGKLDPVIGRDDEIRRLMQVLGRRSKNNPVLVGEAGVGKTAIVEGFAQRLAQGDVPSGLKDRELVELDMGALVAGTSLRGQFEDRLKKLIDEVAAAEGKYILYIDEIHQLAGAGTSGDSGGAADLLKPALARGQLSLVGTTTPAEYRTHIEADKGLERRFQEIPVREATVDETIAILQGIRQRYEIHHRVRILDEAIVAAAHLAQRYVTERKLPDKAVDVIDEAASRLRLDIDSQPLVVADLKRRLLALEVDRESAKNDGRPTSDLDAAIQSLTQNLREVESRIDREKQALDALSGYKAELEGVHKLIERSQQENDLGRAAELKYGVAKEIERKIEAQEAILNGLRDGAVNREEVGEEDIAEVIGEWTGIPTTRMLEGERQKLLAFESRLGERVIGQPRAVQAIASAVRRSRAGLQQRNRPIGNFFFVGPTGVGKTELAKALAEFLFDSEDSLIRIDMSEYMEQSKVNTLIGAAYGYVDSDKGGILTEAVRRRPYSVVLFDEAEKAHPDVFNILLQVLDEGRLTDSQGRRIDFTNTIIIMTSNVGARRILDLTGQVEYEELDRQVHMILRDHFKPEFLNRLDDIVVFEALDRESMGSIADILLRGLDRLLGEQDLHIEFSAAARSRVIEVGYQPEYGARPLKRALLTLVQDPLATLVLQGDFVAGDTIFADAPDPEGPLVFTRRRG